MKIDEITIKDEKHIPIGTKLHQKIFSAINKIIKENAELFRESKFDAIYKINVIDETIFFALTQGNFPLIINYSRAQEFTVKPESKYDDLLDYWCNRCNSYLQESEIVFRMPINGFKKEPYCGVHDLQLKVSGRE